MFSRFRFAFFVWLCFKGFMLYAEEPFDFDKNQGRLPKSVVPQRYEVRIDPDIDKAVFSGDEKVTIEVRQPVKQIVLHANGLQISDAKLLATPEIPLTPRLD